MTENTSNTRAGFAAIIGAPNAGKSTLVNRMVGAKVSIVTQKVQTTRFPVRGVALAGDTQIVLVDTPGIFSPRRRLDRAMVRSAWAGSEEAEVTVHLVDVQAELADRARNATPAEHRAVQDVQTIIEALKESGRKVILALNKIDGIKRDTLLAVAKDFFDTGVYTDVFMISAETGAGVDDLTAKLASMMPESPWLYPEDQTADLPARLLAAEITREKIYLRVHEELPYAASVETTSFEERADGSARIEQTIYVEREGQRAIVLGKGGQVLKWIGQASREELQDILDRKVHLFLHVKVKENWAEERGLFSDMGLDFDV
ncbi:GTPase Era [Caulobacter flavus]|uniref:GTPase Era n=3 Tax=Caulobacter TaxID=75 RepID=A0A2T9IWN2_9CAUL|nr:MULTISPECIES: GTPase Era [Caulobacter]KSB87422.1 GTPase Era [Caulobacter vibrioides]AYV47379.1 GTPase Era [Caulobacter flavus]MDG2528643.1 GTPase Era [Caulobacter endophyticus]NGM50704.1 GTPase Era [Caulobacter sp. 602-2]PLR18222.1 GTPase Era [Caulobacter flavus]